ncbi:MAG TPA: hypothetical protein VMU82_01770 [Acetobacteraceae bacterium]|nr:hypothetical protein [Acetobacteraceae bacterium]
MKTRWHQAGLMMLGLTMPALIAPAAVAAGTSGPDLHAAPSPAGAAALADGLRGWMAGIAGPGASIPKDIVQVEARHGFYRVSIPLPAQGVPTQGAPAKDAGTGAPQPALLRADARPIDAGRWRIDRIRFPRALSRTMTLPANGGTAVPRKVSFRMKIAQQSLHGVYDPAGASPSRLAGSIRGFDMRLSGPGMGEHAHEDRIRLHVLLLPAPHGRFNLVSRSTATGYASIGHGPTGQTFNMSIRQVRTSAEMDNLSADRLRALVQAFGGLKGPMMQHMAQGTQAKLQPTKTEAAAARAVVATATDLMSGLRVHDTLEGVRVDAPQGGLRADRIVLGIVGEAPGPILTLRLDIGLDGLRLPTLPPDIIAMLPQHIAISPVVTGVNAQAVTAILLNATTPGVNRQALMMQAMALLGQGGIEAGVQRLSVVLGPTRIVGHGVVRLIGGGKIAGTARIIATGFDALVQQVKQDPKAAKALPGLLLVRGLAKADGKRLVWLVSRHPDGKLLVNGVDMSAMAGGKH